MTSTPREHEFELLMAYWKNKKFFPTSTLTLDTTFQDFFDAAMRRRLRTCVVPERQHKFEWLKAFWQRESGHAGESDLESTQDTTASDNPAGEESPVLDNGERDRILMEMGFY